MNKNKNYKKDTSWENVAPWYNDLIEKGKDTFQEKIILPNILRIGKIGKGMKILDLACGQGFFSKVFALEGAKVTGVDASKSLVQFANKNSHFVFAF